jgi:hypothetical protein
MILNFSESPSILKYSERGMIDHTFDEEGCIVLKKVKC